MQNDDGILKRGSLAQDLLAPSSRLLTRMSLLMPIRDKAVATRANKRRSHGSEGDLHALATGTSRSMRRRPSDQTLVAGEGLWPVAPIMLLQAQ